MTIANEISKAWEVFVLFLIPIGGGIPAGVLVAKAKQMTWPMTTALYFVSDVTLALIFEPLILGFVRISKRSPRLSRFIDAYRKTMVVQASRYGVSPSPFTLILVSFGVDPMTGRLAARMNGHGFISGWLLAIAGDMIFFIVIMISTLWLDGILGDGTWTAIIIMVAMIIVPSLIRRLKPGRAP